MSDCKFVISEDGLLVTGYTRKGEQFLFDIEDWPFVKTHTWYISKRGYVVTRIKRKTVTMHRILLGDTTGFDVDHISGDRLDNRRGNLRLCTHQQNMFNQRKRSTNTSGYTGVSLMKNIKRYEAYIHFGGKKHNLGLFDNPLEAALARDGKAISLFGDFARLNFPLEVMKQSG